MPDDCPSSDELTAFHGGNLPTPEIDRAAAHLEHCPSCELFLQTLEGKTGPIADACRDLSAGRALGGAGPGEIIGGRYKLIEAIGEGGMGAVWMAQ